MFQGIKKHRDLYFSQNKEKKTKTNEDFNKRADYVFFMFFQILPLGDEAPR